MAWEWKDYLDFIVNDFKHWKDPPIYAKTGTAECAGLFALKDGQKYAANEGFEFYNKPYECEVEVEVDGQAVKKTIEYNEFEAMTKFIDIIINYILS